MSPRARSCPVSPKKSTADAESAAAEDPPPDPAWVEEMFAEAEAGCRIEAPAHRRTRCCNRRWRSPMTMPMPTTMPIGDEAAEESARATERSRAAAARTRQAARSLAIRGRRRAARALVSRADRASPSPGLVLNPTFGWRGHEGLWMVRRDADAALGSHARIQSNNSAPRRKARDGTRLRVRLSVHNKSARVQPLPLVRLTLQDRYWQRRRDARSRTQRISSRSAPRASGCSSRISASMPSCTWSIRAARPSASKSTPACVPRTAPSAAPATRRNRPRAETADSTHVNAHRIL